MDTIWFGIKLGIGILIGAWLLRFVVIQIVAHTDARQFTKLGCTYQHEGGGEGHPNGWMTRDPNNDDWILWDASRNRMWRLKDMAQKSNLWQPSHENLAGFLVLAEQYWNYWQKEIKSAQQTTTVRG